MYSANCFLQEEVSQNPVNFWDVKKKNDMDYEPSASKVAKQERQVKLLLKEIDDDLLNPAGNVRTQYNSYLVTYIGRHFCLS